MDSELRASVDRRTANAARIKHLLAAARADASRRVLALCEACAAAAARDVDTTNGGDDKENPLTELRKTLEPYRDNPDLLDAVLEPAVRALVQALVQPHHPALAAKALYLVCSVRGYKQAVAKMPHRVADVAPCVALLGKAHAQPPTNAGAWETLFVSLLWTSIVGLVPFPLDSIATAQGGVLAHLIHTSESHLSDSGPTRDAAAICLSRLLTRPDADAPAFVVRAVAAVVANATETSGLALHTRLGYLRALAEFFKRSAHAARDAASARLVVRTLSPHFSDAGNPPSSTLERKLWIKLVQRAGVTVASSLLLPTSAPNEPDADTNVDADADTLSHVMGSLLAALSDRDTVTRWSAAKGVRRVAVALQSATTTDAVADVVDSVVATLEADADQNDDAGWHGACLALAELARKRLISLAGRVEKVIRTAVVPGLDFDRARGAASVGTHVRDAACYLCWALARVSEPRDAGLAHLMARKLMMVCLFDREVNCRRAASAALQEAVGRLGPVTFPSGIDIVQTADFVAVGNLRRSFVDVAPRVVGDVDPGLFQREAVATLVDVKLKHWDASVRVCAADALAAMATSGAIPPPEARELVFSRLLPKVGSGVGRDDGWLLGAAALLPSVSGSASSEEEKTVLARALRLAEASPAPAPTRESLFAFGSEETEEAKRARFVLVGRAASVLRDWGEARKLEKLERTTVEALRSPSERVREAAQDALREVWLHTEQRTPIPDDGKSNHARVLWLGATPSPSVVEAQQLRKAVEPDAGLKVEARRDALRALARWVTSPSWSCAKEEAFAAALVGLRDYTSDERGDVGSLVRLATIDVVESLFRSGLETQEHRAWVVAEELSRVACERLDAVRARAARVLGVVCESGLVSELHRALSGVELVWGQHERDDAEEEEDEPRRSRHKSASTSEAQLRVFVTRLLRVERIRVGVVTGLAQSVGGLTESTRVATGSALLAWAERCTPRDRAQLGDALLHALRASKGVERIVTPVLRTLAELLEAGVWDHTAFVGQEDMDPATILVWNASVDGWTVATRELVCRLCDGSPKATVARMGAGGRVLLGLGWVSSGACAEADDVSGAWDSFVSAYALNAAMPRVRVEACDALELSVAGLPDGIVTDEEAESLAGMVDAAKSGVGDAREVREWLRRVAGRLHLRYE